MGQPHTLALAPHWAIAQWARLLLRSRARAIRVTALWALACGFVAALHVGLVA